MSYAKTAANCINLLTMATYPDWAEKNGPISLASTMANGEIIDAFDHKGGGSHKYIPADRLSEELGEPAGAGVYGFWQMKDGSYLLRTCHGALAHWSGKAEDKAEWGMGK